MTTGSPALDDAELEAFLAGHSSLSADYDNLELVEPPAALDEKILAVAKAAAQPAVPRSAPAAGSSAANAPSPEERRQRPRPPIPETDDHDDDDDVAPPPRRPRWLLPVAIAVSVLVAAGVGLTVFPSSPSGSSDYSFVGSLFAKRARERSEADKAAAAAAVGQEAEVVVLEAAPLPPPPIFEPKGPQVQDLPAAIALIRKELALVNQTTAMAEEAAARDKQSAPPSGNLADTGAVGAPVAAPSVIQPRERRLTKILELYDAGDTELAADSLEIFLRDFEDDPISPRILSVKR